MNLGPYATFILLAYAVAVAIVSGMVAWVIADYRAQRRTLDDLERRGVTRRSGSKLEAA